VGVVVAGRRAEASRALFVIAPDPGLPGPDDPDGDDF
jgi:hypothetical protein